MNKDTITASSHREAIVFCHIAAITRLISIIITFLFWFSVFLSVFIIHQINLFQWNILDQLLNMSQVLGIVGLSVVSLTVLSWRLFEKLCVFYIKRYKKKYYR